MTPGQESERVELWRCTYPGCGIVERGPFECPWQVFPDSTPPIKHGPAERVSYLPASYAESLEAQIVELREALGDLLRAADPYGSQDHRIGGAIDEARAALSTDQPSECDHEWVDARNEAVESGEVCLKCRAIRAAVHDTPHPARTTRQSRGAE